MTHRPPPHSLEAEQAVLGSILLSGGGLRELRRDLGLQPAHFYRPRHAAIYTAMTALHDRSEPVDAVTVIAELERNGADIDPAAVHALPNQAVLGRYRTYGDRVIELANLRDKLAGFQQGAEAAERGDWQRVAEAEAKLATDRQRDRHVTVEERQHRLYEFVERGDVEAWPWPFDRLNRLTAGGIRREQFTVLAGWTSHGKSVLLDQVLEHAARKGAKVALYINEMSVEERDLRFVARHADIPFSRLMQADLRDPERPRFVEAIERLPFEIVPAAGMSAEQLAVEIRCGGHDLVGIDLLNGVPHRDTQDIDQNVRTLTTAARQAGCHVIACQHLNQARSVGTYPPRPTLRDIRGSGQIADLASNVMFVYREESKLDPGDPGDDALVHFAKVRNGIQGKLDLSFNGARMRFLPTERTPGTVGIAA